MIDSDEILRKNQRERREKEKLQLLICEAANDEICTGDCYHKKPHKSIMNCFDYVECRRVGHKRVTCIICNQYNLPKDLFDLEL